MASVPEVNAFIQSLESHASSYELELTGETLERLSAYYKILSAWNPKLHLVAPCSPDEFAKRHVLESLLLLRFLPQAVKVADVGSGAGLPVIPCLIARSDLRAVLIESSKKKSVFLREILNRTGTGELATVIAERFENIAPPDEARFITCRALERFEAMLPRLIEWSPPSAALLLFGGNALRRKIESAGLACTALRIPYSEKRFLIEVKRS